ncbi:MAG: Unknown protein [uncultured Thiotrichaceae bacterium]|uniref:Nbr1 FW domain-containing protein n=1 Tax=uncultured Thiotrichaceae bacterium TaxID=298394 RepID=A0A6S6TQA0_9GAMM|nr:MAG: Unknown protein [uncultured Thiotrichaceae bacterium]
MDQQLNIQSQQKDLYISKERGLVPLATSIDIPQTSPGETVELSVTFKAPSYPCTTISYWKSVDKDTQALFPNKEELSCLVNVIAL